MAEHIPPDDREVGEGDPAQDMDDVADVLAEITGEEPDSDLTPGEVPLQGDTLTAQGIPGAVQPVRIVGGNPSGPPQSGTFELGDVAPDQAGGLWVATAAGSPGVFTTERLRASQALTPFWAAMGNRQFARVNVVCVGDSITEGQHATNVDYRWLARLRDMLRARFPTPGLTGGGRGFLGIATTGESSFTWPCTLAGAPLSGSTEGPKAEFVNLASGSQTATWALTGDSADICYIKVGFGGTMGWSVDGGAVTDIATAAGGTFDGQIAHISLGAAGPHTLKLQWVSGASASVSGVVEYDGDYSAGIQVHDCGHFGWETSNWVSVLASGTAGPAAAIASLKPSIVIISLGVNDQYAGVTPATFGTNLQAIITSLKGQLTAPYPTFLLNMYPPRQGQSGYTYLWWQYVAQAWAVAAADQSGPGNTSIVAVHDFTQGPRMPGADTDAYGFWYASDDVHLSNLGHQAAADRVCSFLTAA